MNIQLASFNYNLSSSEKRIAFLEIFNHAKSDFVLFAGHTFDSINDLDKISAKLANKHVIAFLEVKDFGARNLTNWLFRIEKNKILNCHTHQIFTDSVEINKNSYCAEQLLHELLTNRSFTVNDKKICLLICGEINILKNVQSDDNRVEFRINDKTLKKTFSAICQATDIFINPLHSPMGNQGKMHKRREFLSSKCKAYFSTANMDNKGELETRKLHYAYVDGNEIVGNIVKLTSNYIVREYHI